ncbi:hypothetical protein [Subtercola sp. YIM 133946]|uniref:hypothetical protein n=1 Tax=Subtercola sp. YIM 133946 TaxID=3118909 RepID=UPI002F9592F8
MIEIARADPGSGWCYALGAGHQITLASYWPADVQAVAFGPRGEFIAPHNFARTGKALKVDDGWLVDGEFPFGSGVPYSTHFLLTIAASGSDAADDSVTLLLERAEYEVLDDWSGAFGMKASGSNAVRVSGVVVPDARAIIRGFDDTDATSTVGSRLHDDPLYFGRTDGYHYAGLAAVIVGTARAAFDEFERIVTTSMSANIRGAGKADDPVYQEVLGGALASIDSAETLALASAGSYVRAARRAVRSGETFTALDASRMAGLARTAGALATAAIDEMFVYAGTLNVSDGTRMQRYFRDSSMFRTHGRQLPRSSASQLARDYFADSSVA